MKHLTEQWAKVAGSITYEQVTYRPTENGRTKTIFLQNPSESGTFLTGIEVNKEGDEVSGKDFDERRHLLDLGLVTKRVPMVIDNDYGWLVPKTAKVATQRGPVIVYPAGDGKGKWHAINPVAETALCGQPVVLDTRSGNSIHVTPGQARPHPIVCRRCLKAGGWTAP